MSKLNHIGYSIMMVSLGAMLGILTNPNDVKLFVVWYIPLIIGLFMYKSKKKHYKKN